MTEHNDADEDKKEEPVIVKGNPRGIFDDGRKEKKRRR